MSFSFALWYLYLYEVLITSSNSATYILVKKVWSFFIGI